MTFQVQVFLLKKKKKKHSGTFSGYPKRPLNTSAPLSQFPMRVDFSPNCLLKFSGFYKLCKSGKRLNGLVKMYAERAEIREFVEGD